MPLAPGGFCRWQAFLIVHPVAFKSTDKKSLSLVYSVHLLAPEKVEGGKQYTSLSLKKRKVQFFK